METISLYLTSQEKKAGYKTFKMLKENKVSSQNFCSSENIFQTKNKQKIYQQ